ncbi:MAG: transposase [Candidatus Omnitrophica bacterium]|nr:transposase [Candidatus Omnitrophota bacterium]
MSRDARRLVDGSNYHIVTRGIDRRILFRDESDNQYFLDIICANLTRFGISIFHYCLMVNHIHLLIKAIRAADLPKFMQVILQGYACYFRKKYLSVGFIFQNRYKSRLIDNDAYLLECGRYIERNPLRAKIVTDLSKYRWNSYLLYAKGEQNGIVKLLNPLYLDLADTDDKRREAYVNYVLQGRPYEDILDKEFHIK